MDRWIHVWSFGRKGNDLPKPVYVEVLAEAATQRAGSIEIRIVSNPLTGTKYVVCAEPGALLERYLSRLRDLFASMSRVEAQALTSKLKKHFGEAARIAPSEFWRSLP